MVPKSKEAVQEMWLHSALQEDRRLRTVSPGSMCVALSQNSTLGTAQRRRLITATHQSRCEKLPTEERRGILFGRQAGFGSWSDRRGLNYKNEVPLPSTPGPAGVPQAAGPAAADQRDLSWYEQDAAGTVSEGGEAGFP